MIALDRLLRHMGWANLKTFSHLKNLPDKALESFAFNPQWTVSEILHHLVESADFYHFRISGKWVEVAGQKIAKPNKISDLELLAAQVEKIDLALLGTVSLDEIEVTFVRSDGQVVERWRSTILSQAIHHATEHRAQIAVALESGGFPLLDLDELDLWAFEISERAKPELQ